MMTDHREYIIRRLIDPQGDFTIWGESILHAYSSVARLPFAPVFGVSRRSKLVVLGARIFDQMSEETRRQTHLVMTVRDVLRCKNIPRSLTYDLKSYGQIYALVKRNQEDPYISCRCRVELILRKTQAEIVVANSTIDPINRLWIQVGKEMGLKTVCVQHGVYSDSTPKHVLEEDIVDRYVALDEGQVAILCNNIDSRKIVSLGVRDAFAWIPKSVPPKICFVGEDWERYGRHELKKLIISVYIKIAKFLKSHGFNHFYYKPHPSEKMLLNICDHADLLKPKDLDVPDVFIGFASTLLKEVSTRNKLAMQIWDVATGSDNFQVLGYCQSIPNDEDMLNLVLTNIRNQKDVPFIRNARLDDVLLAS